MVSAVTDRWTRGADLLMIIYININTIIVIINNTTNIFKAGHGVGSDWPLN